MQSERIKNLPNVNTLLKISIGLMVVAIISSAFVYAETASVTVDGTSYDIDYTGTGVTVTGVEADLDFVSLIFTVNVSDSPASLDVTFDRSFFDSTYQGLDEDFFVLIDGEDVSFNEISTTSQSRTLSIKLPAGSSEIEIIGSVFGSPVEEPTTEPETPVEEPTTEPETPVEEPVVPPITTTKPPVTTTKPKTECGPGTILKDGVCVLDQRCGPGTILKDGACVLEPESNTSTSSTDVKGIGKELVIGLITAFVVAGAVGIVLGLMSKASKSKD